MFGTKFSHERSSRPSSRVGVALGGVLVIAAALTGGCSNAGEGALSGAGLGALAGLGIGSLTGSAGAGAAIGAIAGGVGGAVIGDQNERRERSDRHHDDW
ncbi:MAG: glycine zipper domain-containing protein [Planctomycetota bacterium]|nr:glycine zipper domain-containing protein [Planctomycetota bacterium]